MSHSAGLSAFLFVSSITFYIISAKDSSPYDKVFLNCGASPKTTDTQGRTWITDIGSKFAPETDKNSLASIAATQDPSVPQVPFMTARIFHSEFTYTFPVSPGRKFVRLYFYPASYANLKASGAVFHVTSGPYTLLRNFSPSQTTEALNFVFIVKEFVVNVADRWLNVTFKPSSNSLNAYAFVNGIEVVSMPDIYTTLHENAMVVGQSASFVIDNSTALEKVYRLNVGGNDIPPTKDSGLFRSWSDDSPYILGAAFGVTPSIRPNMKVVYRDNMPEYFAPSDVYATARTMGPNSQINLNYNLTWIFSIDSGFLYLVRLHFCEVQPIIDMVNQRVFKIFLNNQTAEGEADVVGWTHGNGIPIYRDYVVLLQQGSGQQDLWLELHPNTRTRPQYYDAILNGLEIFKINDSTGNLAGPNPIPAQKKELINPSLVGRSSDSSHSKNEAGIILRAVLGGIVAVCFLSFITLLLTRRWRHGKVQDYVIVKH